MLIILGFLTLPFIIAFPLVAFLLSFYESWRRVLEKKRGSTFSIIDLWAAVIGLMPACLVFGAWIRDPSSWILLVAAILMALFQLCGMAIVIVRLNLNGGNPGPLPRALSVIGGALAGAAFVSLPLAFLSLFAS